MAPMLHGSDTRLPPACLRRCTRRPSRFAPRIVSSVAEETKAAPVHCRPGRFPHPTSLALQWLPVRLAALFSLFAAVLAAQAPVKLTYECTPADVDAFGLNCSVEEPCAVYLELASVEASGNRILVAGNVHTADRTLYSLLLASDDNGVTWTEAHPRIRSSALEQISFFDLQTGWISGEALEPLARDAFFLLTTDGGKTWRQKAVFDDTKFGAISQFQFTSRTAGQFVLDTSRGRTKRSELYETNTGGEGWEIKQTSPSLLRLNSRPAAQLGWRVRADAASGTQRLERGGGREWERVASFVIHVADCRP